MFESKGAKIPSLKGSGTCSGTHMSAWDRRGARGRWAVLASERERVSRGRERGAVVAQETEKPRPANGDRAGLQSR